MHGAPAATLCMTCLLPSLSSCHLPLRPQQPHSCTFNLCPCPLRHPPLTCMSASSRMSAAQWMMKLTLLVRPARSEGLRPRPGRLMSPPTTHTLDSSVRSSRTCTSGAAAAGVVAGFGTRDKHNLGPATHLDGLPETRSMHGHTNNLTCFARFLLH